MENEIIKRFNEKFPPFADGQFGYYTKSPIPHIQNFILSELKALKEECVEDIGYLVGSNGYFFDKKTMQRIDEPKCNCIDKVIKAFAKRGV